VIVHCKIVAKHTQRRYGICIYVIYLAYGKIAIIAQIRVTSTSKISTVAKRLLFKPNWRGVNAKLKIKLSTKGSATINAISFLHAKKKTFPKEKAIRI